MSTEQKLMIIFLSIFCVVKIRLNGILLLFSGHNDHERQVIHMLYLNSSSGVNEWICIRFGRIRGCDVMR